MGSLATTGPDLERLEQLRSLAAGEPERARDAAWKWLRELQSPGTQTQLAWLFEQGSAPEAPHGDCEGIVMNLFGSPWLAGLDKLVRLGQLLGGIGWAGKSFDTVTRTGYNRLTATSRIPALIATPAYRFDRIRGELVGFRFHHMQETSPVAPRTKVLAIKYDDPAFANPLVLPRTRDELVEIVPHVYLGRALLREGNGWQVVGYFGLRYPIARK
jgi:hypothetical protein